MNKHAGGALSIHANELGKVSPFRRPFQATPYGWRNPRLLPMRQWLLGHWLQKGEITALIAPGGSGKSTIGTVIALCLASGRDLLEQSLPRGPQTVWMYNLEDSVDELDRQISAACLFHDIRQEDCGDRLYVDSGLVQPLCTATEGRDGFSLADDVFQQVGAVVRERGISVIIVDPFVSSHAAQENSNSSIDTIVKRWKRLADECDCAVVLAHHTKKMGDREVTSEDSRGAVALRDAARVVLTLNGMSKGEAEAYGIASAEQRQSLIRIDAGKANRSPRGATTWMKIESQSLENGNERIPSDNVGVATLWDKPDVFDGIGLWHLSEVQARLAQGKWRDSVQAKDWVGYMVADVIGLSAEANKGRLKAVISTWKRNGALKVENRPDNKGDMRPFIVVGHPVNPTEIVFPHPEKCGAEGAESAGCDSS